MNLPLLCSLCNNLHFRCSLTLDQRCFTIFGNKECEYWVVEEDFLKRLTGLILILVFNEHEREKILSQIQRTLMKEKESSTWKLISHEDITGKFLFGFRFNLLLRHRFAKNWKIAQLKATKKKLLTKEEITRGRKIFLDNLWG